MKSVVRCLRPILHIRDWAFAILLFGLAFDRALPEIRAFAQSDDATSRAVPIDASFTYQGRIEAEGVPADGAVLMEFKLWDAASGGAAVATVPSSAVAVANGLFAVQLNFGSAHFTGDKRWIETIANGISLGRVELTATPYAAFAQKTGPHSHFGDQWTDSSSLAGIRVDNAGLGSAVFGNNTGSSTGVDGQSVGGIGVFGKTQTGLAGVYAETSKAEGTALFARSFGTAGIAVSGIADVPGGGNDGVGVVGSSGGAPHLSGFATGVSGSAYGSLSVGVYGYAIGPSAEGIHAKAEGAFSVGIRLQETVMD